MICLKIVSFKNYCQITAGIIVWNSLSMKLWWTIKAQVSGPKGIFSIINLLQYNEKTHVRPLTPISQFFDDKLFEEIISYISNHIYEPLSVEDICDTFSISRSFLQNIFKNNLKTSPKLYINELKLKRSRELIKTRKYTINDISSMLGFSSIQYFSRKFTKRFGINPSEYARKIYES